MSCEFDVSRINDHGVVIIVGKEHPEKRALVKDILYHRRDTPVALVITNGKTATDYYSEFVPNLFIHDGYKPETVDRFVSRQRMITRRMRNKAEDDIDPRGIVVMDNCMYDDSCYDGSIIHTLFTNSHELCALSVLTVPCVDVIPAHLDADVDFVVISREAFVRESRAIYARFTNVFETYDEFVQGMNAYIRYQDPAYYIVIDTHSRSGKIHERVFWYNTDQAVLPKFRVCPNF